jgi:hypothetical protein
MNMKLSRSKTRALLEIRPDSSVSEISGAVDFEYYRHLNYVLQDTFCLIEGIYMLHSCT